MNRILAALFAAALLSAPAAWGSDDHERHHGKHAWKQWKKAHRHWQHEPVHRPPIHRGWHVHPHHSAVPPHVYHHRHHHHHHRHYGRHTPRASHGYARPRPPAVVYYPPYPAYRPHYVAPPEVRWSVRVPRY